MEPQLRSRLWHEGRSALIKQTNRTGHSARSDVPPDHEAVLPKRFLARQTRAVPKSLGDAWFRDDDCWTYKTSQGSPPNPVQQVTDAEYGRQNAVCFANDISLTRLLRSLSRFAVLWSRSELHMDVKPDQARERSRVVFSVVATLTHGVLTEEADTILTTGSRTGLKGRCVTAAAEQSLLCCPTLRSEVAAVECPRDAAPLSSIPIVRWRGGEL